MELETVTVVIAITGIVLLYGAVKNRNPLDVIQKALRGEDISTAAPLSTPSAGLLTTTVPGTASAAPGNLHTDGTARFFPNNTPRYTDDPTAKALPAGDPRKRYAPPVNGNVLAQKDATRAQGGYTTGADGFGIGGTAHAGQYNG